MVNFKPLLNGLPQPIAKTLVTGDPYRCAKFSEMLAELHLDPPRWAAYCQITLYFVNEKHLKNVGPIHHCEPPHAHSADVAGGTVARRLRIDVDDNDDDDDNDNA